MSLLLQLDKAELLYEQYLSTNSTAYYTQAYIILVLSIPVIISDQYGTISNFKTSPDYELYLSLYKIICKSDLQQLRYNTLTYVSTQTDIDLWSFNSQIEKLAKEMGTLKNDRRSPSPRKQNHRSASKIIKSNRIRGLKTYTQLQYVSRDQFDPESIVIDLRTYKIFKSLNIHTLLEHYSEKQTLINIDPYIIHNSSTLSNLFSILEKIDTRSLKILKQIRNSQQFAKSASTENHDVVEDLTFNIQTMNLKSVYLIGDKDDIDKFLSLWEISSASKKTSKEYDIGINFMILNWDEFVSYYNQREKDNSDSNDDVQIDEKVGDDDSYKEEIQDEIYVADGRNIEPKRFNISEALYLDKVQRSKSTKTEAAQTIEAPRRKPPPPPPPLPPHPPTSFQASHSSPIISTDHIMEQGEPPSQAYVNHFHKHAFDNSYRYSNPAPTRPQFDPTFNNDVHLLRNSSYIPARTNGYIPNGQPHNLGYEGHNYADQEVYHGYSNYFGPQYLPGNRPFVGYGGHYAQPLSPNNSFALYQPSGVNNSFQNEFDGQVSVTPRNITSNHIHIRPPQPPPRTAPPSQPHPQPHLQPSRAQSSIRSSHLKMSEVSICGLRNFGSTCYINSIVQCLASLNQFRSIFLSQRYIQYIKQLKLKDSRSQRQQLQPAQLAPLSSSLGSLFRTIQSHPESTISPTKFLRTCSALKPEFSIPYEQQDASEFLLFILDTLHNELSDPDSVALDYPDLLKYEREDDEYITWIDSLNRTASPISALFMGQVEQKLSCFCGRENSKFEFFFQLSLSIPESHYGSGGGHSHHKQKKNGTFKGTKVHLNECINYYTRDELLSGDNAWHCPNCSSHHSSDEKVQLSEKKSGGGFFRRKKKSTALDSEHETNRSIKSTSFIKLPPILTIHLSRFGIGGDITQKSDTTVTYPIILQVGEKIYKLMGQVNHYGGLKSGHYTATCDKISGGANVSDIENMRNFWCTFDDEDVSKNVRNGEGEIRLAGADSSDVYVLFYVAME